MKRALLILPVIFLASCGGGPKHDTTPTALPDARTVVATATLGAATAAAKDAHKIGESATIDPVDLTITKATRVSAAEMKRTLTAPETTWLIVELTARNPSNDRTSLPNIEIACASGGKANRYVDDDATAIKSPDMPAKTQLSGRFIYGIPDGCSPAILTAVPVLQIGGKPLPQTWTIP